MNDKNRDTLQIVATILGNISAISAGIALFEKGASGWAVLVALIFAAMAVITIRSAR